MFCNLSLQKNAWELKDYDERLCLSLSQKYNIPYLLTKLLTIRNIDENNINNYIEPDLTYDLPNPFLLIDMEKSVSRVIEALKKKTKNRHYS